MTTMRTFFHRVAAASAITALGACAEAPRTVDGDCGDVFGSQVCTWGTFTGDALVEFGATVPLASIDAAPADAPMEFPPPLIAAVRFPEEVREATGIDHVGINWEAHGHPPETWLTPHFDFHFYTKTPTEMAAVDCANLEKPTTVPEGYALPDMDIPGLGMLVGLCVPGMGMHAARESELNDTELFAATMIVGYYDQTVMSVEPMIAQTTLQERQSFALTMPTTSEPGGVTMWPAGFEAVYDAEAEAYRLTFMAGESE